MKLLDRVTDHLLRFAADRWPAELREMMLSEWLAEIAWLRRQPGTGWRQWRFAASLAARGPHDPAIGRRRPSPLLRSLVVLSLAGVATFLMFYAVGRVVDRLAAEVSADETAAQGIGYLVGGLVLALVFGRLGWLTATRFPLSTGDRWWSDAATATITVGAMNSWLLVMWWFSGQSPLSWPVLILASIPLLWAMVRLFRVGRKRWGWLVGAVGGWLTITTLSIVVTLGIVDRLASSAGLTVQSPPMEPWAIPLWGLGSLAHGNFGPSITLSEFDYTFTPTSTGSSYLVFLVFAATYAIRSRRRPRPAAREAVAVATVPVAPLRDRASVVLAATGILTWATTLTIVTPRVTRDLDYVTSMRLEMWQHGLRLGAILLTVLALGALLAGRRIILVPVTVLAIGLTIMDWVVAAAGWAGVGKLLLLAGTAGALIVMVYTATMRLSRPTDGDSTGLATIAITAAASTPVVMMYWTPDQPWWAITVLTILLMFALASLAGATMAAPTTAVGERAHPVLVRVFANPVARLIGFPVVLTGATLLMVSWRQHPLMAGVLIGPVAVLIAVAVGWKPLPNWSSAWRWFCVGTAAVAASVLLVVSNFFGVSDLVFSILPMDWDARPMAAGAMVIIPMIAAAVESRMRTAVPGVAVARSHVPAGIPATD
ncbi:hypothetical protein FB566_0371 [Stackebrandtia endophytica]|uniref:Uncharacterized protein n=1 Tax=Stackebrandtia endophytica TaxID=1496996 RepID=A0A543AQM7_9ACTN|nr:hypothetical protein [Stackebrandtia endophytica]TQL74882.1 hypothetical protein FB566_0371 [Stackebrandtia endophytica]